MDVLIVDDSVCFRRAARLLLERRGYRVVAEAGTAAAAEALAERLKPAAMLVDVGLPDGTGFGVAAHLTRRCPDLAILLTSAEDYGSCYALADECGARGFVLKSQLAGCDLTRFWSHLP
jgi:DNA-binding NarL/FixJ family response regulator